MYEFAVASKLLEHIAYHAADRPEDQVAKLGIYVGAHSAINPRTLEIVFNEMVRKSPYEGVRLEIETPALGQPCQGCVDQGHACEHGDEFALRSVEFSVREQVEELAMA